MNSNIYDRLKAAQSYEAIGPRPALQRPSFKTLAPLVKKAAVALIIGLASHTAFAHDGHPDHVAEANKQLSQMEKVHEKRYATPRFVETVGIQEQGKHDWLLKDGRVDPKKLLSMWENNGVTPKQAFELINVLIIGQTPIITVSPSTEKQAQELSTLTAGVFKVKTADQAQDFLNQFNVAKLGKDKVIHVAQAMNVQYADDKSNWDDVEMYWTLMAADRLDESRASIDLKSDGTEMMAARAALIKTVQDTGLATLRVPLPNWNDTANLKLMAQRLQETNSAIQEVTGWNGKVLGLNQRVDLTVMAPVAISLTYYMGQHDTRVMTAWEDIGHEWFHTLDYAMRTVEVDAQQYDGASFTGQVRTMGAHSQFEQNWGQLLPQLKESSKNSGHSWYQDKEVLAAQLKAKNHWQGDYLNREFELMAFAWQSNIESKIREKKGFSCPTCLNGDLGPTLSEAQTAQPIWDNMMAQVNQQWWKAQSLQAAQAPVPFAAKIDVRRSTQEGQSNKVKPVQLIIRVQP